MIFNGKKIYYSGSIKGVPEPDPEFAWKLVRYMVHNGADVLSEHVAARNKEEMENIRLKRVGRLINKVKDHPEPWYGVREIDCMWVDEADYLVALVNGPSHGVGMEIERALLKSERGLNFTPVLCLVRDDLLTKLTYMIRGIKRNGFYLGIYKDLEEAKRLIKNFLTT